jgi:hypothetical protein
MKSGTRFIILASCLSFCAGGVLLSRHVSATAPELAALDSGSFANAYEQIASGRPHELTFSELESLIRQHKTARTYHGRIEFGSVKMEGTTAVVQVLFFAPDGSMSPFSYTLTAKNNAWKVESVQRIWFVPRSRLLRGLRV